MKSQNVLETAIKVLFMREEQYGSPEKNLGAIAEYWSIHLDKEITASDVATMLELMKIARRKNDPTYEDNYKDAAGYAALGFQVSQAVEELDK